MLLVTTVALVALAGAGAPAPATPLLALEPVAEEALHGCEEADLTKALAAGLRRGKRFRFLPEGQEAPLGLEVLECRKTVLRQQTVTTTDRPIVAPVGKGVGRGAETEMGVESKTRTLAFLKARLTAGSRFVVVESGPKDEKLGDAAESLRRAIDEALEADGEWLLTAPPEP